MMYLRTLTDDELLQYARSQTDNELAQAILDRLDSQVDELEGKVVELTAEVEGLEKQLEKEQEENIKLHSACNDFEENLIEARHRIEQLESCSDLV